MTSSISAQPVKKHALSFRQIHLDFHTSEHIAGIGEEFDKVTYQRVLREAHVSSVTTFACCHHGWSYHPTEVNQMHPGLKFNLLREQLDACHEIGIKVPVYLTAGVHNVASEAHPEWRAIGADGRYLGWTPSILAPGFHSMCFNSPYLDYLCAQIDEVMEMFPDADGIFFDIISQNQCCCRWCRESMAANGLDPTVESDRLKSAEIAIAKYYDRTTAAVQGRDAEMPIFHNSGHIFKDQTECLKYFSHLELESLPTGGWGYDHFPLSAKYCSTLGYDFLGMTGKFHFTWGEFGGFKHPNALRYECAAMIAFGAKCSVGDQLHPTGTINPSTYRIIGEAYAEVEAKESWCVETTNVADIALLSHESYHGNPPNEFSNASDTGTARMLLEAHYLFDVINADHEFDSYRAILLPDEFVIGEPLREKLAAYLAGGGKVVFSGRSGLDADKAAFLFDVGAAFEGESPYNPDYLEPAAEVAPDFVDQPVVVYGRSQRVRATSGRSLGMIFDPYFNRTFEHFCSHRHTPNRPEPSGFDAAVLTDRTLYFAHPIFTIYNQIGAVAYKDWATRCIDELLGDGRSLKSNLPSGARVSLRDQPGENRYVLHLLYAPMIKRGSPVDLHGGNLAGDGQSVELIEDLPPLVDIEIELKLPRRIVRATVEPEGGEVELRERDGVVGLSIDRFACHCLVALHYGAE